jgi:hypothetical protein
MICAIFTYGYKRPHPKTPQVKTAPVKAAYEVSIRIQIIQMSMLSKMLIYNLPCDLSIFTDRVWVISLLLDM